MQSLWMIAASALFACMGVCVKLGASLFSSAELVFYRGAIALLGLWGFVLLRRLSLATPHWRAHLWRGLAGSVSLIMYFYAISALPLATAVTLNYTSPLFLALILAVWAGERVRGTLILALALGLAGVVLLLRPSIASEQWLGGLAALASGASAGIAYYNVRQLGRLGEPEWRTVFYFSLASTLIGLPWLIASQTVHEPGVQDALLVLGVGGFGALAQLAMTRAYKHGKPLVSASLAYSTVIFASLFGMLLWDEVLPWPSWLGIGLIVASGLIATAQSRAPVEQD
jgi:drug/metabolite transporter (DMT)-like permease